jgi:undecaprenyl-phosphate 4-deoxy-4-formamido-L-arabinose transferase
VQRATKALADTPHEFILVDDGSPGESWAVVRELSQRFPVTGIRLGRNAGQQAALLAGVRSARFETTVTLDDDLQNPPEEIPRLVRALEEQNVDLVYGYRKTQATAWWRRAGSRILRIVVSTLARDLQLRHVSPFRAFRTRLRDAATAVTGPRLVLDGMLQWGTDRVGYVEAEHHARMQGRSGYGPRQQLTLALDVVTGYSTRPLRATSWLGFLSAVFGVGVLAYVIGQYILLGTSVAGFPFLASIIALFSGAQLLSLGIIGEYLARMHVRMLGQPTYVIAEITSFTALPTEGAHSDQHGA